MATFALRARVAAASAASAALGYGVWSQSFADSHAQRNGWVAAFESQLSPSVFEPARCDEVKLAPASSSLDVESTSFELKKLQLEFDTPVELLEKIAADMTVEMERGLEKDGCMFKMLPSYVCDLPTGKEDGEFLALDLGGSNFRVLRFKLKDGEVSLAASKKAKIPASTMSKESSGEALFQFIADTVAALPAGDNGGKPLPLGFTFSFPCTQYALNAGSLVHWTKGFHTPGVEGEDVVGLLQQAFEKSSINVNVAALVNDTVGTLVAHVIEAPDTVLGVILGTGCNACYVEDIANVTKWDDAPAGKDKVIINMEWGAFDSNKIPGMWNSIDAAIDADEHPGQQRFEKQISGRYLGEIARIACQRLREENALFSNREGGAKDLVDRVFTSPHAFLTPMMSLIQGGGAEVDENNPWKQAAAKAGQGEYTVELCKSLARAKGVNEEEVERFANFWRLWSSTSESDKAVLRDVCDMVSTRAARLSAAAIGAVIRKIHKEDSCTVAIDGSVFEHYPFFKENMQIALLEMFGDKKNIKLELSPDGSGKGAALIAAIATPQVAAIATPQVSAIATPREKFKGWRVGKVGAVPEFVDETEE